MEYELLEIFDQMPFIVSFLAGLLSFISPCVLPLIPAYFFYITGISAIELEETKFSAKERLKIIYSSLLFIAGFSTVFILFGASLANLIGDVFGYTFEAFGKEMKLFELIAGLIIVLFGLNILGYLKITFLKMEKRYNPDSAAPFLLGVSFAFGWSPCIGPIFGTIVGMASTEPSSAIMMMVIYTLGLSLPFLLMALLTVQTFRLLNKMKKWLGVIEKISGIILVLIGIVVMFGGFSNFSMGEG